MKIMKYQAPTEKEAMLLAKEELGSDALILSIKAVKPRGIFRLFRKPYVEVTAALDENQEAAFDADSEQSAKELADFKLFLNQLSEKQREMEKMEEAMLAEKEKEEKLVAEMPREKAEKVAQVANAFKPESVVPRNETEAGSPIAQVIYEQLLENEVDSKLVDDLLQDLANDASLSLEKGINRVYRQIVEELSDIRPITLANSQAKPIFFIGSTGVGKTTTIAKLASHFTLEKQAKVALITADTYRIAAVEQLRTYANILNIPIRVIYKEEEILGCLEEFADMDYIFIDTAGRSYQDTKHLNELEDLLNQVEEKQVYLVLSLSTKNSDLKKTVQAYDFTDFSLIFTKLDETLAYGSILNIRWETGKPLSYITTGQNVPEDIAELDPYEIANQIIGGVNS